MLRTKTWFTTALLNLFLAALAGLVMRLAFIQELPIDYLELKKAHGNFAMLGWVYLALFTLLNHFLLPSEGIGARKYQALFWGTEASAVALFIGFIIQGYGAVSLSFLLLHTLFSYSYLYHLWKDTRDLHTPSTKLLRAALVWLIASTLGIWGVVAMVLMNMDGSATYHMAIQFFLHFMISGWFTYGVLALFVRQLENKRVQIPARDFRRFFWLMNIATVLTYALAIAWVSSHPLSYAVNGLGVLVQLGALIALVSTLKRAHRIRREFSSFVRALYGIALGSFVAKVLIQSSLVVPRVAEMAHTIQHLVIGFIHLQVLGFITVFLLGAAFQERFLKNSRTARTGTGIFLAGVLLSEAILFLQGLFFWMEWGFLPLYYQGIFWASVLLPLGIGSILFSRLRPQPRTTS